MASLPFDHNKLPIPKVLALEYLRQTLRHDWKPIDHAALLQAAQACSASGFFREEVEGAITYFYHDRLYYQTWGDVMQRWILFYMIKRGHKDICFPWSQAWNDFKASNMYIISELGEEYAHDRFNRLIRSTGDRLERKDAI